MALPLAAIPMILGGVQAGAGVASLLKNKRPEYEIPDEVFEAEQLARATAAGQMPGIEQSRANVNLLAANALAGAQATGRSGEQLQAIMGQATANERELAIQNAQFKFQAQQAHQAQLGNLAQFRDKEFQMNEFAPYADKRRLAEDMIGAGATNIFNAGMMGGIGGGGGAATMQPPNVGYAATEQLSSLSPGLLPSALSSMSITGPAGFPNKLPSARVNYLQSLYLK